MIRTRPAAVFYFLREAWRSLSVQCWTTRVTAPVESLWNSTRFPSMLKVFSDNAIKGILRIAVSVPLLVLWGVLGIYLWLR